MTPSDADGTAPLRRATLQDVAARAGVSRSTVSLALQNSDKVAEPTRLKILQAVEELGYVYNRSAAGLRTARTLTTGLVIDNLADPFLAGLVAEIDGALGRYGRTAFLCNSDGSTARQDRFIRTMQEYNAEGLMIRPVEGSDPRRLEAAAQAAMPMIQVWSHLPGARLDAVLSDDEAGVVLAIEHLLRLGHREIAYIGGIPQDPHCRVRLDTLARSLENSGLPPPAARRLKLGPANREDGMLALYDLLDQDPAVTAILCHRDEVAFGVMLGLINAGRRPGEDVAVIGWNDVAEAALWYPGLTSIAPDREMIAEMAARMLLDRISGSRLPPRTVRLPPTLKVRRSCGAGRAAGIAGPQPMLSGSAG